MGECRYCVRRTRPWTRVCGNRDPWTCCKCAHGSSGSYGHGSHSSSQRAALSRSTTSDDSDDVFVIFVVGGAILGGLVGLVLGSDHAWFELPPIPTTVILALAGAVLGWLYAQRSDRDGGGYALVGLVLGGLTGLAGYALIGWLLNTALEILLGAAAGAAIAALAFLVLSGLG